MPNYLKIEDSPYKDEFARLNQEFNKLVAENKIPQVNDESSNNTDETSRENVIKGMVSAIREKQTTHLIQDPIYWGNGPVAYRESFSNSFRLLPIYGNHFSSRQKLLEAHDLDKSYRNRIDFSHSLQKIKYYIEAIKTTLNYIKQPELKETTTTYSGFFAQGTSAPKTTDDSHREENVACNRM